MEQKIRVAIVYDFDGTLSPQNMQEYSFIPELGVTPEEFWYGADTLACGQDGDSVLAYMSRMVEMARERNISLTKENFKRWGSAIELYEGVEGWFSRINQYGESRGIEIEHYVNSSGIKEMIEGTRIGDKFKRIFACSFLYDVDGVAYWPGVAVNYTNKTQFIFKINKGVMEVWDSKIINSYMPKDERPIPFENMIYIGDGTTDIPCMRLVKEQRGHSIAVYNPEGGNLRAVNKLLSEGRVDFVTEANYSEGGRLDMIVKGIIDKIATDSKLHSL